MIDLSQISALAAEGEDQANMKAGGGFERPTPEAGIAMVRLLEYIEYGYAEPKKEGWKSAIEVRLRFELHTPNHLITYQNAEGKDVTVPSTIDVYLSKGGPGSLYGKLFTSLNYSGKFNHFAQMVGAGAWLADVTHKKSGDKTYANLNNASGWTFRAPVVADPVAGTTTEVTIPEIHGAPKMFLYENDAIPDSTYKEMWDDLYVDGEYEARDGKPAKSKNIIQERIMASLKFPESRLARIVAGEGVPASLDDLPTAGDKVADVDPLVAAGLTAA